jgi:hypothetical protein
MKSPDSAVYAVPARFRRMENMHVVFWLLKDIGWCMIWKPLGITMIVPTLSVAIWISWKNRESKSELAHNLAIVFWITANAYWMISEFIGFDSMKVWGSYTGKHIALIPFFTGAMILLYYYLIQRPRELKKAKAVTL